MKKKYQNIGIYIVVFCFSMMSMISCNNNKKEVIVEMPWGNGYYIGTVNEANEPEGIGAYCYESGVTCGYYHNGKRNGKFVSIGENGYLAMTECVNDSMNGWGWVKSGGITWAGEFMNDELNGVAYESYYGKDGKYIHSYVGDFVDGRYDGVGRHMVLADLYTREISFLAKNLVWVCGKHPILDMKVRF